MAFFFIADTHFFHKNVISFSRRPFADLEEMNSVMLKNWNARVKDNDNIYIVGDICHRVKLDNAIELLKQLNGRKHLVVGNHDKKYLKNADFRKQFKEVEDIIKISVNGQTAVLCHYPMAEWNRYFRGGWHIHGHIHNRRGETFRFMRTQERALNAGVDITNFSPVSFEELKAYNDIFKAQEFDDTEHDTAGREDDEGELE